MGLIQRELKFGILFNFVENSTLQASMTDDDIAATAALATHFKTIDQDYGVYAAAFIAACFT